MTHTAIVQNNLAVAHLRANNIPYARLLSTSALQEHHRTTVAEQAREYVSGAERSIDQCMLLSDPDEQATEEAANAFIYKAGIEIPTTETDPAIITPIIVFNTALAHHLLAEQDCVHSVRHFQKAKDLYELAYRSQGENTNMLFEFAILNNVAMIHREFGIESSTANQYFDYLLSAWMVFVDQDCSLQLRQVRGFLLNLLPTTVVAAVAA